MIVFMLSKRDWLTIPPEPAAQYVPIDLTWVPRWTSKRVVEIVTS